MINFGASVPGIRTERQYIPRIVEWTDKYTKYLPQGRTIAGSLSRDTTNTNDTVTLQPGVLMGKVTATGKYRPSIIGLTSGAIAAGTVTSITVPAAVAVEVARLIAVTGGNVSLKVVGPPTAAGTVATQAVTATAASGTTITISSATLAASVTGSIVTPADGSETPVGVLNDFIRLTDVDGNNLDCQLTRLIVSAFLDETQIINYPSDTSLKTYVKGALNAPASGCGPFVFKGNF